MREALLSGIEAARWVPLRYLNLFRLVLAGLFLVAGRELNLGGDAPRLYYAVATGYLAAVLVLGFPDAARRLGLERLITLQAVIDVLALAAIMWASGGYRSGMPVLMMVILAGAGLVAEGRMVLFFAALATVLVLAENAWRFLAGGAPADFLQVGIVCLGFFGIAISARLLALRAKKSEWLATQRGEALARQQAINERIIRDMQDGVLVIGHNGVLRQANPRASELLGVALEPGLAMARVDAAFADCRLRWDVASGCVERLGAAGRLLRARAAAADGAGAADETRAGGDTVVYLTDFGEVQKQAQQLKLAALGRLTASMAHEIRNPLAAVTQAAELLKEEQRAEVQRRLVRIINDNALRIERMVRDVLALGRHDASLVEALPLAPCVAELVEEYALRGTSERALFALDLPPGLSLAIDRAHLHQILANLFDNARRHCRGGPGAIRVWARAEAGGRVALHICDDGAGVPAAEREQVFEPFFTTHPQGTGLGLYIARELAEANGATLELVDNAPGAHFLLAGRSQP